MTVNFRKQENAQPPVSTKIAMPVGTSILLSMDKFMFDKRDINCTGCRNGYKSTLPKQVDGKIISVAIVCTCVPYFQSNDGSGTGVVVYKGRRENWVKYTRPESETQAEYVREGMINKALKRKDEVEDNLRSNNNVKGNSKYEKALREKANLEKAIQNGARPPQKVMQQDKQGHWIFVDLEMGKKMGLQVSSVESPLVNPDNPEAQAPAPPPQAPGRQESDEEYLLRTSGEAPIMGDVSTITEDQANKIEAARAAKALTAPKAAIVAPTQAPIVTTAPVKKGRGRPKGSTNRK